jgi:hypothetical protein
MRFCEFICRIGEILSLAIIEQKQYMPFWDVDIVIFYAYNRTDYNRTDYNRTIYNNTNYTNARRMGNDAGFEAYVLPDLTAQEVQEEGRRDDGLVRGFADGDDTSTAAPAEAFAANATEPPNAEFTQKSREEVIYENLVRCWT